MTRTLIIAFAVLFGSLSLPACSTLDTLADDQTFGIPVGDFVLTSLGGTPLPSPLPQGTRVPTLSLDRSGGVSGVTGVNRFSTLLDPTVWADGEFKFGDMATTRMAGPPAAMAFEQDVLGAMSEVRSFSVEPGVLILEDAQGAELMRYAASE